MKVDLDALEHYAKTLHFAGNPQMWEAAKIIEGLIEQVRQLESLLEARQAHTVGVIRLKEAADRAANEAETRLQKLEQVKEKYVWHLLGCASGAMILDPNDPKELAMISAGLPCDCGYDAALADLEKK